MAGAELKYFIEGGFRGGIHISNCFIMGFFLFHLEPSLFLQYFSSSVYILLAALQSIMQLNKIFSFNRFLFFKD